MAVWSHVTNLHGYYCDECVVDKNDINGCPCQWNYVISENNRFENLPTGTENADWRWVVNDEISKKDGIWVKLAPTGRPFPCVEYIFDIDGFDII